jgi:hypothetical protein
MGGRDLNERRLPYSLYRAGADLTLFALVNKLSRDEAERLKSTVLRRNQVESTRSLTPQPPEHHFLVEGEAESDGRLAARCWRMGQDSDEPAPCSGDVLAAIAVAASAAGLVDPLSEPIRIFDRISGREAVVEIAPEADLSRTEVQVSRFDLDLPTGQPRNQFETPWGLFTGTFVNLGSPTLLLFASQVGATGAELPDEWPANPWGLQTLEQLQRHGAQWLGLPRQTLQVVTLAVPMSVRTIDGGTLLAAEVDVTARGFIGTQPLNGLSVDALLAIAAAAAIPGTVAAEVANRASLPICRIGLPDGGRLTSVDCHRDGIRRVAANQIVERWG